MRSTISPSSTARSAASCWAPAAAVISCSSCVRSSAAQLIAALEQQRALAARASCSKRTGCGRGNRAFPRDPPDLCETRIVDDFARTDRPGPHRQPAFWATASPATSSPRSATTTMATSIAPSRWSMPRSRPAPICAKFQMRKLDEVYRASRSPGRTTTSPSSTRSTSCAASSCRPSSTRRSPITAPRRASSISARPGTRAASPCSKVSACRPTRSPPPTSPTCRCSPSSPPPARR